MLSRLDPPKSDWLDIFFTEEIEKTTPLCLLELNSANRADTVSHCNSLCQVSLSGDEMIRKADFLKLSKITFVLS